MKHVSLVVSLRAWLEEMHITNSRCVLLAYAAAELDRLYKIEQHAIAIAVMMTDGSDTQLAEGHPAFSEILRLADEVNK